MSTREAFVKGVLVNAAEFSRLLLDLTYDEVLAALELEAATSRRGWFLNRLIGRVVALEGRARRTQLSKQFIK